MKLTAPEPLPAPPPRVRLCGACKAPFVTVPDDERDAFALPAEVCTCGLTAAQATLAQAGFVPADDAAVNVARKANWPRRYGPLKTTRLHRGGAHLVVVPFVSPVIPAALRVVAASDRFGNNTLTDAQAELVATMLRRVTDPTMRDAMNAAVRIAGDDAARDLLFGPLRDAAGEQPDTREDMTDRIARIAAKVLRGTTP